MTVINTNTKSLVAQQSLNVNNRSLGKAMEQLSTGKRINSAADDAAGLAIANKMTAQVRGLNQAVRNANDGISMIQTFEGATNEVTNMLQRMRELAVQSANDTYNDADDRVSMDAEFQQLATEIGRISDKTEWNGMAMTANATKNFQVGAKASDSISVDFKAIKLGTEAALALATDVTTAANAGSAITAIDKAMTEIDAYRGDLGAKINRLTYAADNLTNVSTNTSASRSRIQDADYAQATTELARTQIIQQAATAMLAQANQAPQSVLSLLR